MVGVASLFAQPVAPPVWSGGCSRPATMSSAEPTPDPPTADGAAEAHSESSSTNSRLERFKKLQRRQVRIVSL